MISLVITNYNSASYIEQIIDSIINDNRITEILIVDDKSTDTDKSILSKLLFKYNTNKINILFNEVNLGSYKNKIYAVSKAANEWVILLDADNHIDSSYINAFIRNDKFEKDTFYCPMKSIAPNTELINYEKLVNISIDKLYIKNYINDNIKMLLNTGNYIVNRDFYIKCSENDFLNSDSYGSDAIYLHTLGFEIGLKLYVVKDMNYYHTVRYDSHWSINSNKSIEVSTFLLEKLKN